MTHTFLHRLHHIFAELSIDFINIGKHYVKGSERALIFVFQNGYYIRWYMCYMWYKIVFWLLQFLIFVLNFLYLVLIT